MSIICGLWKLGKGKTNGSTNILLNSWGAPGNSIIIFIIIIIIFIFFYHSHGSTNSVEIIYFCSQGQGDWPHWVWGVCKHHRGDQGSWMESKSCFSQWANLQDWPPACLCQGRPQRGPEDRHQGSVMLFREPTPVLDIKESYSMGKKSKKIEKKSKKIHNITL